MARREREVVKVLLCLLDKYHSNQPFATLIPVPPNNWWLLLVEHKTKGKRTSVCTYNCISGPINCHYTTNPWHTKWRSDDIFCECSPMFGTLQCLVREKIGYSNKEHIILCSSNYHTNACCSPEYAIRGMAKTILTSVNGATTNFDRDSIEACRLDEDNDGSSSLLSSFRKNHISAIPNVTVQRKIMNKTVVPLVLPPCRIYGGKKKLNLIWRCHYCTKKVRVCTIKRIIMTKGQTALHDSAIACFSIIVVVSNMVWRATPPTHTHTTGEKNPKR